MIVSDFEKFHDYIFMILNKTLCSSYDFYISENNYLLRMRYMNYSSKSTSISIRFEFPQQYQEGVDERIMFAFIVFTDDTIKYFRDYTSEEYPEEGIIFNFTDDNLKDILQKLDTDISKCVINFPETKDKLLNLDLNSLLLLFEKELLSA